MKKFLIILFACLLCSCSNNIKITQTKNEEGCTYKYQYTINYGSSWLLKENTTKIINILFPDDKVIVSRDGCDTVINSNNDLFEKDVK